MSVLQDVHDCCGASSERYVSEHDKKDPADQLGFDLLHVCFDFAPQRPKASIHERDTRIQDWRGNKTRAGDGLSMRSMPMNSVIRPGVPRKLEILAISLYFAIPRWVMVTSCMPSRT